MYSTSTADISKVFEIRVTATDSLNMVSGESIFKIYVICTQTIAVLLNPVPASTTYNIS